MKTYIYVQAYHDANGDTAFRHCFLKAKSDNDAYAEGARRMDAENKKVALLNDYVVELPVMALAFGLGR